jgi:RHS repeat-associated protein
LRSTTASGCSKDFNGHVTSYNYDVLNRLLSKTPDPVLAEPTVSFTYTSTGQRATMNDATGTTTYTYDNRDRLTEKATPEGTLTYTYDSVGNVTSIRSSNVGGTDVQYTWDVNNRLKDVIDSHAGTFTYSYDGVGAETGLAYPNGIAKTTTYDGRERLSTIGYKLGATTVASYAYTVANSGHRTQVVENTGRTAQYGYDALYRLTSETVTNDPNAINGRVDYTLDNVGNRMRRDSSLGPVSNQVSTFNANDQVSTVELYDLNGNVVQDSQGNRYAWNFEGSLLRLNDGENVRSYDGDGVLTSKTDTGFTTLYLVDQNGPTGRSQVVEELAVGATTYVFGREFLAASSGVPTLYALSDGQTSVRVVVDGSAAAVAKESFDAFGVEVVLSGVSVGSHRYLGERWDGALGAVELRARYCRPSNGRFLSPDRWAGSQMRPSTLTKYAYGEGDPVGRTDRLGLYTVIEGAEAEMTIQYDYLVTHPDYAVDIHRSFTAIQFDTSIMNVIEDLLGGRLRPDISNTIRKEFYEIKPFTDYGQAQGPGKVALYQEAFDATGDLGWHGGNWPELPVSTGTLFRGRNIYYWNEMSGLIFWEMPDDNTAKPMGLRRRVMNQQFKEVSKWVVGLIVTVAVANVAFAVGMALTAAAQPQSKFGL